MSHPVRMPPLVERCGLISHRIEFDVNRKPRRTSPVRMLAYCFRTFPALKDENGMTGRRGFVAGEVGAAREKKED